MSMFEVYVFESQAMSVTNASSLRECNLTLILTPLGMIYIFDRVCQRFCTYK